MIGSAVAAFVILWAGSVLAGVDRGAGLKIRELIERRTQVADELPDGVDSNVRVHLCRGHDEPGEITTKVTVDSDGTAGARAGSPASGRREYRGPAGDRRRG